MGNPIIVSAADLSHIPEAKNELAACGEVRYVAATHAALSAALADADAYYASLEVVLTDELMSKAPRLRAIATPSTGLDHIDLDAAQRRGVAVLCLKDDRQLLDDITATAELAWGLLLACARRFPEALEATRNAVWSRDALRGHQLSGKTLGILGCGRLGTIMAQYGQAFRMKIIGCDTQPVDMAGVAFERVSFDRLLRESDVISIHIHLTPENRKLIDAAALAKMKPNAILINTSRGAIIDEHALVEALTQGRLAAAGVDVIEGEWRDDLDQHPLIAYARTHGNLVITPHVGGVTFESQAMAYAAAARKLHDFLHTPQAPV